MENGKELKAVVIDNFLSIEEVEKIISFAKLSNDWERADGIWNKRSLTARNIYNSGNIEIGKLLYSIRDRIRNQIKISYGLDDIYPDLIQIVRWFDGQEQPPHADDMKNAGPGHDWFHHRDFGSIIYLNDEYSGGKTYYPQHDFSIDPVPGRLAIHPGDSNHLHGVTKISGGTRYTIASFWTKDKEYNDNWTIH